MTTPAWVKPGTCGALIGAAAAAFVGFSWGGWVTRSSADELAAQLARDEVTSALVPICVELSRADPDRVEKLKVIISAPTYRRSDAVMDAGWTTMPGSAEPRIEIAQACIEELDLDAS
jgi:hypothetical protein